MTSLFTKRPTPALVGVLHLQTLPGAPYPSKGLDFVEERAVADAVALSQGGADALIIENLGDAPFTSGQVDPFTVAAMSRIALAVRRAVPDMTMGINVLRNDALSALSIATAVGAEFLRVNVLTGAMVTDQGIIQGRARDLLLERNRLGSSVKILADIMVKHAVPLGSQRLIDVAKDTWGRGGADALVVTGAGTGRPSNPEDFRTVQATCPDAPLFLGSGLTLSNVEAFAGLLDAAIVGTWLHEGSDIDAPLDPHRVRQMKNALATHSGGK